MDRYKCTRCYMVHSLSESERDLLKQDKLRLLFTTTGKCAVCGQVKELVFDHEVKPAYKNGY